MHQRVHLRRSTGARGDNIDKSRGQIQINKDRKGKEPEKEKKPEDAESGCERARVGPRTRTSLILPAFVCHNLGQRPMMYGCFILCRCSEGQESGSQVRLGTSGSSTAANSAAATARGRP